LAVFDCSGIGRTRMRNRFAGLRTVSTHEEPDFMHDHRTRCDHSCAMCHGRIEWEAHRGSFCANPACHDRKRWEMNLDPQARE
jgi:hypothetical protein